MISQRKQPEVRLMLPRSLRCGSCGTYICKGTELNSRKEERIGETYLGMQIFRFNFKCTRCSAEITFKTGHQNPGCMSESETSQKFEPLREENKVVDKENRKQEAEMGDAMRAPENRANDSKQDMDILAALEQMRSMKPRHAGVSVDQMLEILKHSAQLKEERTVAELDEEDEKLIKSITCQNSRDYVKRIEDDDDGDEDFVISCQPSVTEKINGSSESVLNPTDVLTRTNGPEFQ